MTAIEIVALWALAAFVLGPIVGALMGVNSRCAPLEIKREFPWMAFRSGR